jgi:hypothetical protein
MTDVPKNLQSLPVGSLHLDRLNPRLPEDQQGRSESEILSYLYDKEVLEELAQSMVDNGFFTHEPLIVVDEDSQLVVVEGNRRFAALSILLQTPIAREADLEFDLKNPLVDPRKEDLQTIPCWVAASRAEVRKFLGFRHIGGIRKWSPEAKARYLATEVDVTAQEGSNDPFRDVGRRVGSNAQGVRNPYLALALLRTANAEFGIDARYVLRDRFGVWNRCMNSPDLKDYIGLGDPRTYPEVNDAIQHLNRDRLAEVISDLSPRNGQKAVLADSRDVTVYAAVLRNSSAREVLREYDDLQLARQVVDNAAMPARIQNVVDRLDLIIQEIQSGTRADVDSLRPVAEALFARASTLRTALRAMAEEAAADA